MLTEFCELPLQPEMPKTTTRHKIPRREGIRARTDVNLKTRIAMLRQRILRFFIDSLPPGELVGPANRMVFKTQRLHMRLIEKVAAI